MLLMSSAMFCLGLIIIIGITSVNPSYAAHLVDVDEPLEDFERIRVHQPLINAEGQNVELKGFDVGQDLVARTAIQNNHYYSNQTVDYLLITEVRRLLDGITVLLNTERSGTLSPDGQARVDVPWAPDQEGIFQVRMFAITINSSNPQILSSVKTAEVPIYTDSNQVKLLVAMDKRTCDENCHGYTVELYDNGIVAFYGRDYVAVQGMHLATVSDFMIESLLDEFYRLDFFSLDFDHPLESDGPPSIKITLDDISNGNTKTVFHNYGGEVPDKLFELEEKIDAILGTERWVYGKEE